MKRLFSMLVFGFFLSGVCAEARGANATYIVPAEAGGNPAAVSYPVLNFSLTQTPTGTRVLLFSLPEDLVGPNVAPAVLYQNARGVAQFTGAGISALCSRSGSTAGVTDCKLTYSADYLNINPESVILFLKQKYEATPEVIAEKLAQSQQFLRDPEGIISF